MDKHTLSTIVWFLFVIAFGLSCWSLVKAHTSGVVTRSSPGSFKYRRISRDEDPPGFQRYMIGLVIINIVFVIVLVVWGMAIFLWYDEPAERSMKGVSSLQLRRGNPHC